MKITSQSYEIPRISCLFQKLSVRGCFFSATENCIKMLQGSSFGKRINKYCSKITARWLRDTLRRGNILQCEYPYPLKSEPRSRFSFVIYVMKKTLFRFSIDSNATIKTCSLKSLQNPWQSNQNYSSINVITKREVLLSLRILHSIWPDNRNR